MKHHWKLTGLFLLSALLCLALVAGCGSGSSSSGGGAPIGKLTFSGTVVDTDDNPVAGAQLQLASRSALRLPFLDAGSRAAYSATTDDDGNFSFTGLVAGFYDLHILQQDGLVIGQYDTGGQFTQSVTGIQIRVIRDETQWNATINTDDSHPYNAGLGYLQVDATSAVSDSLSLVVFNTSTGGGYEAIGYVDTENAVDWSLSETSTEGRAYFYGVTPGSHTLEAQKRGYTFTNQSVTAVAGHINIVAMEGVSTTTYRVAGYLTETDNSTPIAGAEVELSSRSRSWLRNAKRFMTTTNAQGEYAFPGVPAGNYTVRFSKTGYVPLNMLLTVNSNMLYMVSNLVQEAQWDTFMGDANHPYEAGSGYILVQAVRQDNGSPIPGVAIVSSEYFDKGYLQDTVPYQVSWTDSVTNNNGVAFFYETNDNFYNFTASKNGYTFQNLTGIVPIPGEMVFVPIFATAYPSGFSLSGNIKEIDGTAIAEARVTIVGTGLATDTDLNGAFSIAGIPEGEYTVRVTKDDYRPTRTVADIDQDITGRVYPLVQDSVFDFHHGNYENLSFALIKTVRASDNSPLRECVSTLIAPANYIDRGIFPGANTCIDFLQTDQTSDNGYTFFYDVMSGGSEVTYHGTKTGYTFDNGAIPQDQLVNGEVYYAVNRAYGPDTFTVSGIVMNGSQAVTGGLSVELQDDPSVNTVTNDDGTFSLAGVPYGKHLFVINRTSYASHTYYSKSNNYRTITQDVEYAPGGNNLEFMCFSHAALDTMFGAGKDYDPSGVSGGYMAVMGTMPSRDGNIPKTVITLGGEWNDMGYLADNTNLVDWDATYAYTSDPVAVFYEIAAQGSGSSLNADVNAGVHNPGWIFPDSESGLVFPGELTILEVGAQNYPVRSFSGIVLTPVDEATVSGANLKALRHYDGSESLYSWTTNPDGSFGFTQLPASNYQDLKINTGGVYLPTTVTFPFFNSLTGTEVLVMTNSLFTQVFNTPDSGHPYQTDKYYYMAQYLDADGNPLSGITADFNPYVVGNIGYQNNTNWAFDWSGLTTGNKGRAVSYGYGGNHCLVGGSGGSHSFDYFNVNGGSYGNIVQILMRELTHP